MEWMEELGEEGTPEVVAVLLGSEQPILNMLFEAVTEESEAAAEAVESISPVLQALWGETL
jgi:hypothetical protein